MIIKNAVISGFGQLKNKGCDFDSGINLIYGENGSGKTTLYSFLSGMLFGVTKSRGRAAKNDLYKQYEPLDSPGNYSGSITFECGERSFRLMRDFASGSRNDTLISKTDSEILSIKEGDLDMLLGYINKDTYTGIASVPQERKNAASYVSTGLREHYMNTARGIEDNREVKEALTVLETERKQLEKAVASEASDYERKIAEAEYNLTSLNDEKNKAAKRLKAFEAKESGEEININRKKGARGRGLAIACFVVCALLIIAAFVLRYSYITPDAAVWVFNSTPIYQLIALAAILAVGGVILLLRGRKTEQRIKKIQEEEASWQLDYLQKEYKQLEEKAAAARKEYDKIKNIFVEESENEIRLKGVRIAEARIKQISESFYSGFSLSLKDRMNEIFQEISGDRYADVFLNDRLEYGLFKDGKYISEWQCSKGTRELLDFSLRMAAYEAMSPEEPLPIMLDDAFVNYDDKRVFGVIKWLIRQKRQIFIFTCQSRERAMLEKLGAEYRFIRM